MKSKILGKMVQKTWSLIELKISRSKERNMYVEKLSK